MIFSTYQFILLFLPIVFTVYFVLHHLKLNQMAKIWLILASFYFYAQGSPDFFPFFMGSVIGNYIIGTTLGSIQGDEHKRERKLLLLVGVLANVGLLGYYKYTDFFISNFNYVTGSDIALKHIILPIGISFFTFQLIAFLVDSYRGETQEYDVTNYLLFITFFPQLIVGPIIHHKEVVPQFADRNNQRLNYENVAKGLFIFSIGCAKKMLLADPLTTDAELFFNNLNEIMANGTLKFLSSWFYSLEYTVSYYFDLSGYADMAIGLGWMFNIAIPQNFDSPYKAKDFQDYWKRWHMTLSRFLGAYIFRSVYKKNVKYRNYYIATMVTFFVSGFWHGAGWTFVVWGVINGALVCIAAWRNRKGKKTPLWLGVPLTFILAILVRVLFVSNTFTDAWNVYEGMFNFASLGSGMSEIAHNVASFVANHQTMGLTCLIGLFICWFTPTTKTISDKFTTKKWYYLVYAAVLLSICIFKMDKVVQFLYFQF
ncbi:MAG: MBOAT family protein [Lachnospiraceae bacterium]|nr:MBOAT family protein [Lachnospiraceae bacterium]